MFSKNKKRLLNSKISRIRMILFTRKISQNELGKLANMSAGTVSNIIRRIENNEDLETKFMRRNLQLIGKALKIQPEKLIGYLTLEL